MGKTKKDSSLLKKLPWFCAVITIVTVFFVSAGDWLYSTPVGEARPTEDFDSPFYDFLFKRRKDLGHESKESPDILHLAIDDDTLITLNTRWPFSRKEQIDGFEVLAELGAKNVVFDIEYLDKAKGKVKKSDIAELKLISEDAFSEIENILKSDALGFIKRKHVRDIGVSLAKSVQSITPDEDKPLAEVLVNLKATVGIHTEGQKVKKVDAKKKQLWEDKFSKNILCIEEEGVPGKERTSILELRTQYFETVVLPTLDPTKPWKRVGEMPGEVEKLVKRWPNLANRIGVSLLDLWAISFDDYRAIHWVEKNNSVKISKKENDKKIVPTHYSLVQFWKDGAVNCGLVDALSDPDGIVRRVPLYHDVGDRRYFQLALLGYLKYRNFSVSDVEVLEDRIRLPDEEIPLEDGRWLRVNWIDSDKIPADKKLSFIELHNLKTYKELALSDLVEALIIENRYEQALNADQIIDRDPQELSALIDKYQKLAEEKMSAQFFESAKDQINKWNILYKKLKPQVQGKLVFVGLTASSSTDRRPTPIQADVAMVTLQATVADSVIRKSYVNKVSNIIQAMLIAVIMFVMSRMLLVSNFKGGAISWVLAGLAIYGIGYYLFAVHGLLIRGKTMIIGTTSLFIILTGAKQLWDYQIRMTVSKTLSPNIVEFIVDHPKLWKQLIRGKNLRLTVLFSDIKGFTKFCEGQQPDEVKKRMNQIMDKMSPCILEEGGTVDKFMGDCVMAFFGAPTEYEDHAIKAIRAAERMRQALNDLVDEFTKEGLHPLDMGIGISTGQMTIGNFGSSDVEDFSIIGDAVNQGSRIEGLTRTVNADILISEETYNDAKDLIESEFVGEHQVKGKAISLKLWKFCGFKQ